nr:hypothetical protein [Tanacetum cinerariifolium]
MVAPSSSRYSSNDMVHNHYLEEAKKKIQERGRNSRPSVMPSAGSQSIANGATPPKPKASVWKTRSSSDITITSLSVVAGPRLTNSKKGKQAAKASKAKSISALPEVAITKA